MEMHGPPLPHLPPQAGKERNCLMAQPILGTLSSVLKIQVGHFQQGASGGIALSSHTCSSLYQVDGLHCHMRASDM